MPFQSEKQRRYMHANLPRIAKRWERDYANGGIIALAQGGRIGFYKGSDRHGGTGGRTSSGMDMSGATNVGGTTGSGLGGGPHGGGEWSGPTYSAPKTKTFTGPNIHGEGIGSQTFDINKRTIALQDQYRQGASQRAHPFLSKVKSGIGNIFHGLGNKIFQGRGNYENQAAWEQARQDRINKKSINRLRKTRDYGKYANNPQGWAGSDLSGRLTGLEKDVFGKDYVDYGRNRIQARDLKALKDKQALTSQLSANNYYTGTMSFEDQVAKNKRMLESLGFEEATGGIMNTPQGKDYNYNNMKMMEVANNPALSRYKKRRELAPTKFNDPWAGPEFQQVDVNDKQKTIINNQMYNLNSGTKTVKEVYDAAKTFDSNWFGKPMTPKEFNEHIKSKGWTGELLDESEST